MEFSEKQMEKASKAKSDEELISLAKEENITLTADDAKKYFKMLNTKEGEIAEEELDNVTGGTCYSTGVEDPTYKEWRQYAIVSPYNSCPIVKGCKCYECASSFTIGATWYCDRRWKTRDGEQRRF